MKEKILIVDDEKELCESIKNILAEKGYSCIFAYDGGSCLSMVEKEKPNIILLDIMMPGIDGFEIAQRLKHNEKTMDIPIIILTVLGDSSSRIAGLKAGADDYLVKPFDPDELLLRIEANLRMTNFSLELKKKIEQLKEQERIKAEFLSHITQDISMPLQDISKEANLLISSEYGGLNEKQKESVKEINNLCSKGLSLILEFLEIAKANSGKIWIEIEEFSLKNIIYIVSARCKNEANAKGLSFEALCPEIKIKTDKVRLIKILDELLLNAIKFTEKGNVSLLVKEDKENDAIIFEISDTAPEIPKEYLDKVFKENGWLEGKTGLLLVKKLVGLLKGNISAYSTKFGNRFTIVLPRIIDAPARRKEDKN
ncbi:MAG: hybrid sensor histidine kinase/response regulator [bacterium]